MACRLDEDGHIRQTISELMKADEKVMKEIPPLVLTLEDEQMFRRFADGMNEESQEWLRGFLERTI